MTKNDSSTAPLWDIPVALALLTCLPLPRIPDQAFGRKAQAAWAYPVAGALVGCVAAGTGALGLDANLPPAAAAGLLLIAQALITGAMHEDGLADTADGIWGGADPAERLAIMKDSRTGTFGVLALILITGLRWIALTAILSGGAILAVVAAATWSRAMMPVLMTSLPNARNAGLSHTVGRPGRGVSVIGVVLALLLALVIGGASAMAPVLVSGAAVLALGALAKTRIGGQTGDILGAAQQIAEAAFLLAFAAGL